MAPGDLCVMGALEARAVDALADRLVDITDQPVCDGKPGEDGDIALGDREGHVDAVDVAPLRDDAAALQDHARPGRRAPSPGRRCRSTGRSRSTRRARHSGHRDNTSCGASCSPGRWRNRRPPAAPAAESRPYQGRDLPIRRCRRAEGTCLSNAPRSHPSRGSISLHTAPTSAEPWRCGWPGMRQLSLMPDRAKRYWQRSAGLCILPPATASWPRRALAKTLTASRPRLVPRRKCHVPRFQHTS